jgi:NhaA family Na+:H+ antiporter
MPDSSQPPESWSPVRRVAAAIASPIQRILAVEAASGIVLLVATVVALIWANVGTASYAELWHTPIGARVGPWAAERTLHFLVNDGAMTIFFFVVGLEIRREVFDGELSSVRKAALPLAAAIGGMLVPAAIYAALNAGRTGAAGWAIPMATDIAFAVGVLTLLGSRVSVPQRVLLLALAVIDDIGAIIVIAIFYTSGLAPAGFFIVAAGVAVLLTMRWAGVRAPLLYLAPGIVIWAGFLVAGIHPTIAGVLLGLLTPVRPWREAPSPAERLVHALHPWVAFVIMPIFALANAGVELGGASLSGDSLWIFIGIVAGLALGKPLGITAAALGATKAGVADRSSDVTKRAVFLVGLVGGIGFTMSLFIAQLAFSPGPVLDTAKLAILVASGVAMLVGLTFGLVTGRGSRTSASPAPPPP